MASVRAPGICLRTASLERRATAASRGSARGRPARRSPDLQLGPALARRYDVRNGHPPLGVRPTVARRAGATTGYVPSRVGLSRLPTVMPLAGLRCSQLDAQATFEPMIEVGLVDSLDHLDHLHGCVPFFALGTASTAAIDTALQPCHEGSPVTDDRAWRALEPISCVGWRMDGGKARSPQPQPPGGRVAGSSRRS
jgi:hypothetical protein